MYPLCPWVFQFQSIVSLLVQLFAFFCQHCVQLVMAFYILQVDCHCNLLLQWQKNLVEHMNVPTRMTGSNHNCMRRLCQRDILLMLKMSDNRPHNKQLSVPTGMRCQQRSPNLYLVTNFRIFFKVLVTVGEESKSNYLAFVSLLKTTNNEKALLLLEQMKLLSFFVVQCPKKHLVMVTYILSMGIV